jgi:hypothetical protein
MERFFPWAETPFVTKAANVKEIIFLTDELIFADVDSELFCLSQSSSGIKPSIPSFPHRLRTKTSASGMTMYTANSPNDDAQLCVFVKLIS